MQIQKPSKTKGKVKSEPKPIQGKSQANNQAQPRL
jgi:hypothetical protein